MAVTVKAIIAQSTTEKVFKKNSLSILSSFFLSSKKIYTTAVATTSTPARK